MSIASILDPRFKMFSVEWTFERLYLEDECTIMVQDVKSKLKSLFDEYCNAYKISEVAMSSSKTSFNESNTHTNDFVACLNSRIVSIERKSELDEYLDKPNLKCMDPKFDVLKWWSQHCSKFWVLSEMEKDIFGIPITTVAFESAFSAGGRILDDYRSSRSKDMVELLVCGGDWLKGQLKNNLKNIETSCKR